MPKCVSVMACRKGGYKRRAYRKRGVKRFAKVRRYRRGHLYVKVRPFGYAGSKSSISVINKLSPKLRTTFRAIAQDIWTLNSSGRCDVTPGVQNLFSASAMFSHYDLSTLITVASANKTQKFLWEQCFGRMVMTNQGISSVFCDIYFIINRRDTATATVQGPYEAWTNGIQDEGGSSTDWSIMGNIPSNSLLFQRMFKIKKITRVLLSPGEVHEQSIMYKPNKFMPYEDIDNASYGVRNLTAYVMTIVRPAPYNDSTTKTQVTTGNGHVDWVFEKSYKYRYVSDNITTFNKTNNLVSAYTVQQDTMNLVPAAIAGDYNA